MSTFIQGSTAKWARMASTCLRSLGSVLAFLRSGLASARN